MQYSEPMCAFRCRRDGKWIPEFPWLGYGYQGFVKSVLRDLGYLQQKNMPDRSLQAEEETVNPGKRLLLICRSTDGGPTQ